MSTNEPLFATLRFVSSSGGSPSGKRRIAQHACDDCLRRKKRCFHGDNAVSGDGDDGRAAAEYGSAEADATKENLSTGGRRTKGDTAAATSHPRYIGDLNPEVELLAATTRNEVPKNSTGVWHSDSIENAQINDEHDISAPGSILHDLPLQTQQLVLPALKKQCLRVRPPKDDFLALERYYFERIHPVLPSIDGAICRDSGTDSLSKTLRERSICLLASTGWNTRQHLRLDKDPEILSPTDFARIIVSSMRLIIDLALVSDKIVLIYALTTMSLFVYGQESLELTTQYFFRAIQIAYSIGLHQPRDAKQDEKVAGLFSYLWSIDRLHAAIQCRPVVMHEVDMAKSPLSCARDQEPAFKVVVHIAALLNKVIGLYRPTAQQKDIPDEEFPLFEELLEECHAMSLRACDQALLELFYHSVAVLSCRYSSGPTSESLHTRNARQTSSAAQILAIMDELNATTTAMLPFVPYAVSLAMSTAYHSFRHGKVTTQRERAWKNFVRSHRHLEPLGAMSWSAAFMSNLANKVLQEAHSRRETGHSSPIPGTSADNGATTNHQVANPNVADFSMDEFMADLNLDLDGIFEGALDPSMPLQFQDASHAGFGW